MGVIKEKFGVTKDGREVYAYTLSNANGMSAKIIDYGAILVSLMVPDQNGVAEDVVLGYDSMEGYFANGSFFGATIGRAPTGSAAPASRSTVRLMKLMTMTAATTFTAIKRTAITSSCGRRRQARTA